MWREKNGRSLVTHINNILEASLFYRIFCFVGFIFLFLLKKKHTHAWFICTAPSRIIPSGREILKCRIFFFLSLAQTSNSQLFLPLIFLQPYEHLLYEWLTTLVDRIMTQRANKWQQRRRVLNLIYLWNEKKKENKWKKNQLFILWLHDFLVCSTLLLVTVECVIWSFLIIRKSSHYKRTNNNNKNTIMFQFVVSCCISCVFFFVYYVNLL